jgi:predicted O-methyltransferase YrrM
MAGSDSGLVAAPSGPPRLVLDCTYIGAVPVSTVAEARKLVGDTGGGTGPSRGSELHRFVLEHRPVECLELGFAHGVGTVYIASALEANGQGRLTSVDNRSALERDPSAQEMVERAGLTERVQLVYEDTSYTWFLHDKLREQLRDGERIEPLYDFIFLDGAHTWDVDALAFLLADRLLKPGGHILLDDLDWKLDERWPDIPDHQRELAQVREVWDLLALTSSEYDEFKTDGGWGWLRKSASGPVEVRTVVKRDLVGDVRELVQMARTRMGRRR